MIKEEKLFRDWGLIHNDLVRDGIINHTFFQDSRDKILFLLKEVNRPKGGSWDIRPFLQEGGRSATWNNITRWIYGIRNLKRKIIWKEISKVSELQRKELLKSVAIINIKKTPGKASSINKELWSVARDDRYLLKRQIEMYNCDIIICCGHPISSIIKELIYPEIEWLKTSRGITYYIDNENRIFIDYYHPAIRVDKSLLFYGLYDALIELKKKT